MSKLIIFEGVNGVGKTTIARMLVARLEAAGQKSVLVKLPGVQEGTLGNLVNQLHHGWLSTYDGAGNPVEEVMDINPTSLQLMHVAAQFEAIEKFVQPALERGEWVVLDRYWWSTWVYGRIFGVERESLRDIVAVAQSGWRWIRRDLIVLVEREKEHSVVEKAVVEKYREVAEGVQFFCDFLRLINDGTVEQSVEQVWQALWKR